MRTGMGPDRAAATARAAAQEPARAVAVLGFCGALAPDLEPGDLVVADELRGADGPVACEGAVAVAGALQSAGVNTRRGALLSVRRIARDSRRAELAADGSIAVDMES